MKLTTTYHLISVCSFSPERKGTKSSRNPKVPFRTKLPAFLHQRTGLRLVSLPLILKLQKPAKAPVFRTRPADAGNWPALRKVLPSEPK